MSQTNSSFNALVQTVQQLRSEKGCPWDKKQTTRSLRKYLIEEFGEIIDAIDNDDPDNLCEELGDFLYLILMIAEISKDEGKFTLEKVILRIDEKLIRRHPHVFATKQDLNEEQLRRQWTAIKENEKTNRNNY